MSTAEQTALSSRFQLLGKLGEGMGVVYEVLDTETQERLAAKALREMEAQLCRDTPTRDSKPKVWIGHVVLHTHRNTVLRRITQAEALLPRPLEHSRIHVAVALDVLHWQTLGAHGTTGEA